MRFLIAIGALGALTAACAAQGYQDNADKAVYAQSEEDTPDPRVGPEVDRICFQRTIDGWKEADGYDRSVLLETGVNNWYLVRLSGACRARDFAFAQTIGIESRPAGGCVGRGDVIIVADAPNFTKRCFINQINTWDDDAPAPGDEDESEIEEGT